MGRILKKKKYKPFPCKELKLGWKISQRTKG